MTTADITIDTGTNELLCAIRDRVAVITLNRPEARNALSDHLTPALRSMIKICGENLALLWQILLKAACEQHLTVRAS
jgi:enoyl-CoA hydratase/carnithine racemase